MNTRKYLVELSDGSVGKICPKCLELKQVSDYYLSKLGYPRWWCKTCIRDKDYERYHKNNPEAKHRPLSRRSKSLPKYGEITVVRDTIKQFMLEQQNYKCLICEKELTMETSDLDHDHNCCQSSSMRCGKCFRGVLCRSCNMLLGLSKDSVTVLERAAFYLSKIDYTLFDLEGKPIY